MSDPTTADSHADRLRDATAAYREATDAVEEYGREQLEAVRDAYEEMGSLLRQFENKATGTGAEEFVRTAQVRHNVTNYVEELDESLPERAAFERAASRIDKRRLSPSDFSKARDALSPVESLVDRLEDHENTREALKTARQDTTERLEDVETRIDELERVRELAETEAQVDLTPLRTPVEQYNNRVTEQFQAMRTDESARSLFELLDRARSYPLVYVNQPPQELSAFVFEAPAGEESVTQLLEYADYSRSKLNHYVDDADQLKRRVATQRTYLERLDAEPLTVSWPPPTADVLPWRTRALRSVVAPLLDETATEALRDLEALARDQDRYERLRRGAAADAELTDEDRDRLERGEVRKELDRLKTEEEQLEAALESAPDPS